MIYCENKIGRVLIDDEFNIGATDESNLNFIKVVLEGIQDKFAPENGSPTYILANELESFGFLLLDVQLPFQEQLDNVLY